MKEQVLKTMVEAVDSTMTFCKSDFYRHDLRTLAMAEENAKFMWSVRAGSTTLLMIDYESETERLSKSESYRFQFMHNSTMWLDHFIEASQWGGQIHVYDGNELKKIGADEAPNMARHMFMPTITKLQKYVTEYFAKKDGNYNRRIDIEFCDGAFEEVMKIARTDEGVELLKVLRRFHEWARRSADHKIYIERDFMDKSFVFVEIAGNEMHRLNGGIIYNDGHWTIHT